MKLQSSIERTQSVTKCINEFKTVYTMFTKEGMAFNLRNINCPYARYIFPILKKTHQIKKVAKGMYEFVSAEPVYYKSIQKDLDGVVEATAIYCKKW